MEESELSKVEFGLEQLIKKYKKNLNHNDKARLEACIAAKKAIRRVILNTAIHGSCISIIPIMCEIKGAGFKIILSNQTIKFFHGKD